MKFSLKFFALALSLLLVMPVLSGAVSAKGSDAVVSPGVAVIAEKSKMTVTGMSCSAATFNADAFDLALGTTVKEITVLTLPDPAEGTLYLGSNPIAVNQSIGRKNFSRITFKPADTKGADATFYFTHNDSYATECHVMVIDTLNLAPTVSDDISIETMRGIDVYGSVSATDPEGDALTYYVTTKPKKGSVTVTDNATGTFVYTPEEKRRGRDSFSLCVVDEYGNISDEIKVSIKINKNTCGIEYSDLDGHWAHNAALEVTEAGVMSAVYVDDEAYFYPAKTVTREEFVTMVMKSIGLSEIPDINKVVFADDGEISEEARNYCRAAEKLGFISGSEADGKVYFNPKSTITRAEAAVILRNIIKADVGDSVAVFADNDSIPTWAYEAVYAMRELGIMNGMGGNSFSPGSTLTRAEVASILATVIDMVE